jgi:hypothetical protein
VPYEPLADLVTGMEDVDRDELRLGLVGTPIPEHFPHLFRRCVDLDLVVVFLHRRPPARQRW